MTMESIGSIVESKNCELWGIAALKEDLVSFDRFTRWISNKNHGSMTWIENHLPQRRDPSLVEENCNRAILIGIPYFIPPSRVQREGLKNTSKVASYARYEDYHKFVSRTGKAICEDLKCRFDPEGLYKWRPVSDSIPMLERSLHSQYTRSFVGKNTMVIHPQRGSWYLLMEILTSYPFESTPVQPIATHARTINGGCGTCRRCQVHCPTGALDKDYVLDASKCLSYLTIEHRSIIPLKFWKHFSKYWYGCDICQNVCPYNRAAKVGSPMALKFDVETDLWDLVQMSQPSYERWFGGTPMTRAKRNGLRRNAFIAMAALGDPRLSEAIQCLSGDEDPMLVDTAGQAQQFLNGEGH